MKKITLMFALSCLVATVAVAEPPDPPQLKKGNILLGVASTISLDGSWGSELMSLGFTSTKHKHGSDPAEDAYKCSVWNFLPKVGYFVIDNLAAGIETAISGYKEKSSNDYDNWSESMFAVGPWARYYYPLEKFYPFAELELLFGSHTESYNDNDYKSSIFMVGVYVGAAIPVGERVTFDGKLGYANATFSHKGEMIEDIDSKYLTGGIVISAGFTVYLPLML